MENITGMDEVFNPSLGSYLKHVLRRIEKGYSTLITPREPVIAYLLCQRYSFWYLSSTELGMIAKMGIGKQNYGATFHVYTLGIPHFDAMFDRYWSRAYHNALLSHPHLV
jgi:hypothetical protein